MLKMREVNFQKQILDERTSLSALQLELDHKKAQLSTLQLSLQSKEDEYSRKLDNQIKFPISCLGHNGKEIAAYIESMSQINKEGLSARDLSDREFQFFM